MIILRIAAILLVANSLMSLGQLTIDATRPGPGLQRSPSTGSYGSIAGELPLQVTLMVAPSPKGAGMTEVDFLLTNIGQNPIVLPMSPNPRDIEPSDPHIAYTMTVMTLSVSPDANFKRLLKGGSTLYGNKAHPNTLLSLPPGKFLRIVTKVAIPAHLEKSTAILFGYVGLQQENIKTYNNKTISDARGLGSIISAAASY